MTSNDLVVVLPGITGSTLGVRGTDGSPAASNLIWAPSAGAVWKMFTGGDSVLKHALPAGIGDDHPGDGVEPVALMPDVHAIPGIWTPIRGYDVLVSALERLGYRRGDGAQPPTLIAFAYDWRLSNRYNGRRLGTVVEPALERLRARGGQWADAKVVFVCHSMGGLVARWYIEKCGGAEVTRKLVTLGTPWRGATDALEQLVNGVRKGIGPLSVDLTQFARSMPSLHQLLPEYACIGGAPGAGGDWAKTTEVQVPNLDTAMVADAMAFHTDLQAAEAARPASRDTAHLVLGVRQPTQTTVTFRDGRAVTSQTFGSDDDYGDGTVTLTGAVGLGETLDTNLAVRVPDQHTNLQCNPVVLDQVQEILTAKPVRRRDLATVSVRAVVPDLVTDGHALRVAFDLEHDDPDAGPPDQAVTVTVRSEGGAVLATAEPRVRAGHGSVRFPELPPGTHTVTITGSGPVSTVRPVTSTTLVWPTAT